MNHVGFSRGAAEAFSCRQLGRLLSQNEATMRVPTPDITAALVLELEQLRDKYLQFQTRVKIADETLALETRRSESRMWN